MINRVLIRIKVVQLLYSYLLVENQFSLESQPSAPTKEKRFAYNLYLDLLNLMADIASSIEVRGKGYPLLETRFLRKVLTDEKIKSIRSRNRMEGNPFSSIADLLAAEIKESGLFKQFVKNGGAVNAADELVLKDIFNNIIMTSPELNALISQRENYSLKGVDRMRSMIDETFTNFLASAEHLPDALNVLKRSLDKARELYFRLLLLPIAITELREREIEEARFKYLKNEEDINPNLRFVENEFVRALAANEDIREYQEKFKIFWLSDDLPIVRSLLKRIMDSEIYHDYMDFPATDFHTDCDLWRNILKHIVFVDSDFLEFMEDKSVFWNDDLDFIGTFVIKTIRRFDSMNFNGVVEENPVLPMFKDDEDAAFGAELFTDVIRNKDYYRDLINNILDHSNWEMDRMAYMDIVIIMTALAEILNFPKIPINVSLNEYIEIAKYYSTPRSGQFINGLLGDIIVKLQDEGKLNKRF